MEETEGLVIIFVEKPFDDIVLEGDKAFFLGPPRVGIQVGRIVAEDADVMAGADWKSALHSEGGGERFQGFCLARGLLKTAVLAFVVHRGDRVALSTAHKPCRRRGV